MSGESEDLREIECEFCEGTGRQNYGHANDPYPPSRMCGVCFGTGKEEIELQPITLADLDQ